MLLKQQPHKTLQWEPILKTKVKRLNFHDSPSTASLLINEHMLRWQVYSGHTAEFEGKRHHCIAVTPLKEKDPSAQLLNHNFSIIVLQPWRRPQQVYTSTLLSSKTVVAAASAVSSWSLASLPTDPAEAEDVFLDELLASSGWPARHHTAVLRAAKSRPSETRKKSIATVVSQWFFYCFFCHC